MFSRRRCRLRLFGSNATTAFACRRKAWSEDHEKRRCRTPLFRAGRESSKTALRGSPWTQREASPTLPAEPDLVHAVADSISNVIEEVLGNPRNHLMFDRIRHVSPFPCVSAAIQADCKFEKPGLPLVLKEEVGLLLARADSFFITETMLAPAKRRQAPRIPLRACTRPSRRSDLCVFYGPWRGPA